MSFAVTSDRFTSWDDINHPETFGPKCIRPEKKVSHSGGQNCFCCATNTHACHPELSPSCTFSITGWLELRDDGWGQRGSSFHAQACVSRTRSPAAINLVLRPLKPASSNATALQTKEEIRSRSKEKKQDRESEGEKENKLFTLTSNVPQRVVKRKPWASVAPLWALTDGKWVSARAGIVCKGRMS